LEPPANPERFILFVAALEKWRRDIREVVESVARPLASQRIDLFGGMGEGTVAAVSKAQRVNRSLPEFVPAAQAAIRAYEKAMDRFVPKTGDETAEYPIASMPLKLVEEIAGRIQAEYRIVALEVALMPFAAMADRIDENVADGHTINPVMLCCNFRRARAALRGN
jgi:hypothetical protein